MTQTSSLEGKQNIVVFEENIFIVVFQLRERILRCQAKI